MSFKSPQGDDAISEIEDAGVDENFQAILNFLGAGVTVTEDVPGGKINITIPGSVGVNTFILGFHDDGSLGGGAEFGGWFSDDPTSTESHAQGFLAFAYTIVRGTVHVGTNSSNGITDLVIRLNGVDIVATAIAVPASTTGSFDTGAISEAVAANDLTNLEFIRNGSATFSDYNYYAECEK